MAEFAPLFPLETQFQAKDGRNNTAGFLKVFLAATDTPADTYSDYTGTRNPEIITLDNNGRAVVICDKDRGYRLEVYDANGALLWTEEPVFCTGSGGGATITNIVSTNGSVTVDKSTVGGTVTYDLGIAPSDSPEFLEWSTGFRGNMTYGSDKIPNYSAGTMSFDQYGVMVYKDRFYHITNKFFIKPLGTGVNYETFEVALMLRDPADGSAQSVEIRKWDIDTSLTDEVQVEMSFDLTPSHDGELYWKFYNSLPKFQSTDAWIQIHRVYSGINAVPDTCATKQWVSSNYIPQSASSNYQQKTGMSAYVPYSAIDGDGGAISGINGSAISGMLDTSTVIPFSALEYNASSEITGISGSAIGGQVDTSQFMPASAESSMVAYSALEYSGGQITGISGSSIGYGVDPSQFMPASASGDFYPMTGNPSGFLTAHQDISDKLDVSAFTSYSANLDSALGDEFDNIHSALDDKMNASASGDYYPMTGNPSGFITNDDISGKVDESALSSYMPYSSLEYSGSVITAIEGSAIGGGGVGGVVFDSSFSGDGTNESPIGLQTALKFGTGFKYVGINQVGAPSVSVSAGVGNYTSTLEGGSVVFKNNTQKVAYGTGIRYYSAASDINASLVVASSDFISYNDTRDIVSSNSSTWNAKQDALTFGYDSDSAISAINGSALAGGGGVVTSTASGEYYDYRTGQLGYYTGICSANESALIANFATISDYARFDPDRRELSSLVTKDYVDSSISGKADSSGMSSYMPYSSLGYSGSVITSIDGSAIGGQGGQGHEYSGIYPVNVDNTADEISVDSIPLCLESPLSSYMSGDSAVINIDLSNYQPSGAYIYESALGWAEV